MKTFSYSVRVINAIGEMAVIPSRKIISLLAVAAVAVSSLMLVPMNSTALYDEPVTVTTDKIVYVEAETVQINVSVASGVSAFFSSTCQCFFVVENSSGNVVYDMRNHYYWLQIPTFLTGPKIFMFTWDQRDDAGQKVHQGNYEIWGYIAGYTPNDNPRFGASRLIFIGENPFCEVLLTAGWNLFSLPLLASNYTSASLGLPNGSMVVKWNPRAQSYGSVFLVGHSPPSTAFPLTEGAGYWIYVMSACTLVMYGDVPTTTHYYQWDVPSEGGWVLVGFPMTPDAWHASDIASWSDLPESIDMVCYYDNPAGAYVTYIAGFTPSPGFGLTPAMGYWVHLDHSVTVAYGP